MEWVQSRGLLKDHQYSDLQKSFTGFILENFVFSKCSNLVGNNLSVFNCTVILVTIVKHVINGSWHLGCLSLGVISETIALVR